MGAMARFMVAHGGLHGELWRQAVAGAWSEPATPALNYQPGL